MDGRKDIISGSYNPGYLFVFARNEDGSYAKPEKIQDANGKSVKVGYAAHVYAADWDSDKDLDLVIGNISGEVYLVRNEGTPEKNSFGQAQPLSARGERITVKGGDAGPILADWDSDGLLDLIVGAGDGSVTLFRNVGTKVKPRLREGKLLISASNRENHGKSCGTRTKICVTDFDGDGRQDLLVGDFASVRKAPEKQTEEQKADAEEARKQYQVAMNEYMDAQKKSKIPALSKKYRDLQIEPKDETPDEATAREEKAEKVMEEIQAINENELKPLLTRLTELRKRMPSTRSTYHGFVWLYLRQPNSSE